MILLEKNNVNLLKGRQRVQICNHNTRGRIKVSNFEKSALKNCEIYSRRGVKFRKFPEFDDFLRVESFWRKFDEICSKFRADFDDDKLLTVTKKKKFTERK